MSKRLVNAALSSLLCIGLLIWQLSAPAYAVVSPQGPPAKTRAIHVGSSITHGDPFVSDS